jgi:hypothetical protein
LGRVRPFQGFSKIKCFRCCARLRAFVLLNAMPSIARCNALHVLMQCVVFPIAMHCFFNGKTSYFSMVFGKRAPVRKIFSRFFGVRPDF